LQSNFAAMTAQQIFLLVNRGASFFSRLFTAAFIYRSTSFPMPPILKDTGIQLF
jgi:hypothetical protein